MSNDPGGIESLRRADRVGRFVFSDGSWRPAVAGWQVQAQLLGFGNVRLTPLEDGSLDVECKANGKEYVFTRQELEMGRGMVVTLYDQMGNNPAEAAYQLATE